MGTAAKHVMAVVCAAVATFALAVALGLRLTPAPRTRLDYLVIGSVATFLMLGVIFGMALVFWIRPRGLLGKGRKQESAGPEQESGSGSPPADQAAR
ncbi:MAG: hypothetical protein ACPL7M_06845 [Bryobacteraceae bacterium]